MIIIIDKGAKKISVAKAGCTGIQAMLYKTEKSGTCTASVTIPIVQGEYEQRMNRRLQKC
jgi:hypothetical protein